MKIAIATLNDLDELAILFNSYRTFYKQEPDFPEAKKFLNERMINKESVIFVSKSETVLMNGFVQLYPIFSSVNMKRCWLLNDLFVSEDFRKMGVAKLLIEESKKLARETNASGLLLETSKSNVEGNKLYPATGFVLQNETNFYFWPKSQLDKNI